MEQNERMRLFFDRLAPDWVDDAADEPARDRIAELMALPQNAVIADIGCGKGVLFERLLAMNPARLYAVELSGRMLESAKERFDDKRISYINEDALQAPLPALDAAVLYNAYPHFIDKKALAQKLASCVRTGGCVVIAHSRGRAVINARHSGGGAMALSAPLGAATEEAAHFAPAFVPETLVDEDGLYFIKLRRV